jgi:hypothetical protein
VGGVTVDFISAPVGLVQPANSAQIISPNRAEMARVFCIFSAFVFVYF